MSPPSARRHSRIGSASHLYQTTSSSSTSGIGSASHPNQTTTSSSTTGIGSASHPNQNPPSSPTGIGSASHPNPNPFSPTAGGDYITILQQQSSAVYPGSGNNENTTNLRAEVPSAFRTTDERLPIRLGRTELVGLMPPGLMKASGLTSACNQMVNLVKSIEAMTQPLTDLNTETIQEIGKMQLKTAHKMKLGKQQLSALQSLLLQKMKTPGNFDASLCYEHGQIIRNGGEPVAAPAIPTPEVAMGDAKTDAATTGEETEVTLRPKDKEGNKRGPSESPDDSKSGKKRFINPVIWNPEVDTAEAEETPKKDWDESDDSDDDDIFVPKDSKGERVVKTTLAGPKPNNLLPLIPFEAIWGSETFPQFAVSVQPLHGGEHTLLGSYSDDVGSRLQTRMKWDFGKVMMPNVSVDYLLGKDNKPVGKDDWTFAHQAENDDNQLVTVRFPTGHITTRSGDCRAFKDGKVTLRTPEKLKTWDAGLPQALKVKVERAYRQKQERRLADIATMKKRQAKNIPEPYPDRDWREDLYMMEFVAETVVIEGLSSAQLASQIEAQLWGKQFRDDIRMIRDIYYQGAKIQIFFAMTGKKDKFINQGWRPFEHSVKHAQKFFYPYLDNLGNPPTTAAEVLPPQDIGRRSVEEAPRDFKSKLVDQNGKPRDGGVLLSAKGKGKGDWIQLPIFKVLNHISEYQAATAVSAVRENSGKFTALSADVHRALIVKSRIDNAEDDSEDDLVDDTEDDAMVMDTGARDSSEEFFLVYIKLRPRNQGNKKDLIPQPRELIELAWTNSQGLAEPANQRWTGVVVHAPESELKNGQLDFVILAERMSGSCKQQAYDTLDDALKYQSHNGLHGLPVQLLPLVNSVSVNKAIKAIARLSSPDFRELRLALLGRHLAGDTASCDKFKLLDPSTNEGLSVAKTEEWTQFTNKVREWDQQWQLDVKQQTAILRPTKGQYISIVQGPPGTGKTRTAACAAYVMPLACGPGLCVAASNAATDEVVRKLEAVRPKGSNISIIHVHVPAAESAFLTRDMGTDFEPHSRDDGIVDRLAAAYVVQGLLEGMHESDVIQMKRTAEHEHMTHFQQPKESLGQAIMDRARLDMELIRADHPTRPEHAVGKSLLDRIRKYNGRPMSVADLKEFKKEYKSVAERVLKKADIVVTTCANAADGLLKKFFKPKWIMIDDSAHAADPELIFALTSYKSILQILMYGDQKQLGPLVQNMNQNELGEWRKLSMFERFMHMGLDFEFLDLQFRMTETIAYFANILFYGGKLRNAPLTSIPNAATGAVKKWLDTMWKFNPKPVGRIMEICWMNVTTSRAWKEEDGHSYENYPEAIFIAKSIKDLVQKSNGRVKYGDIGVINFYKAQDTLIRKTLRNLFDTDKEAYKQAQLKLTGKAEDVELDGPEDGDLAVESSTVDAFLGREKKVIVLGMVLSGMEEAAAEDTSAGQKYLTTFMRDPKRLCVALTRAQCGLIIVGNMNGLSKASRNGQALRDLIEMLKEKRFVCDVNGIEDQHPAALRAANNT